METPLNRIVQGIARDVRRTDMLWAAGLSGGICAILGWSTGAWLEAGLIFLASSAGLFLRYHFIRIKNDPQIRQSVEEELLIFERLRAVLQALPEPVILLRQGGTIDLVNPAAEALANGIQTGMPLTSVLRAPALSEAIRLSVLEGKSKTADFIYHGTTDHDCRAYISPLKVEMEDGSRHLLVFISDLSQERRLNEMRSDFIANASHELRTPLTSMLGFIETLRGHAKDDPEASERFLGIMEDQARRMQRLVKDLMSLSTIELNENIPPGEMVDLVQLAEDVTAALAPVAENFGGMVSVENCLPDTTEIPGDRDELFQVMQNLIENALKYSGESPRVTVRIGRGEAGFEAPDILRTGDTPAQIATRANFSPDDLVYFQVRDEGEGIGRVHLPRLTERFYRTDVEKSRSRGGTGLGLAIVKHIVNRHKGGLQIESSPGHGAAFTVYFLPQ